MLEFLSFIPRRSLVRRGGFGCQWGVQSVNLYYKYAFEKCTEGGMLAPKKISLIAFAMDYQNSDSSKNHLYGIRLLHIFLQRESTKAQLLSKLAASMKTMARLIRMLDWTSQEDKEIRLFAAKVTVELAKNLTKIDGEIGITLQYKISEDPFLLNNLAKILEDSSSSQELRELTIDIITNLAMYEGIRQEIGSIQVILTKLMYAFLARDGPSNAHSDCSMPIKAGQALAMPTLESVDNCSAILKEPGVEFIKDLARMLHEDRYRYMAASLLRNLCTHSRAELSDSDLGELSHALPEVLERVMDAERKELEVLVGISSQICSLIPESFMQALEQGPNEARFVEKLVNALNVNMKPSAQCPGIRRVVIEQSISMMELNSRYANQFRDIGLMNALSRVEKTPSRAEKYRLFLGNAGLMEHRTHLSSLVVRAKQLMTMH